MTQAIEDPRTRTALHLLLLATLALAVFANNFDHSYPLDSGHMLLENSYVRSLRHIPRYFSDALTMTSLASNADYRPVLMVTYALNYFWSGYRTWSWHLVQIILHFVTAAGLYFLGRRLVDDFHPDAPHLARGAVPLLASILFTVHPTSSGVINYLSARSSLLVAALLMPSFVFHLAGHDRPGTRRTEWLTLMLYTAALFTKVEAVAALGVYFLLDLLAAARERQKTRTPGSFGHDLAATCTLREVRRLAPFLLLSLAYFVIRARVIPAHFIRTRQAPDVNGFTYLCTQFTAWWYYVAKWFAPVNLVADHTTYPVQRSLGAPPVILALGGLALVAVILGRLYKRFPYLAVLALAALALLSPTSSVLPLVEMVNEHRPYLPLALLSLVWLIPGLLLLFGAVARRGAPAALAYVIPLLVAAGFFSLTWQRNLVFASDESYYLDIIRKIPNIRAYNNYGLVLRGKGRESEAREYFLTAARMAPGWHVAQINLGISYQKENKPVEALRHYTWAVETEKVTGTALVHRGYFFLDQKRYADARRDFERSLPLQREFYTIYKGMAAAYAGLGDWQRCLDLTRRCWEIDPAAAEADLRQMSIPYWDGPDGWAAGIEYYRRIDRLFPGRAWVAQALADLERRRASGAGRERP